MSFYTDLLVNVSEETIKQDFYNALEEAKVRHCSNVAFRNKEGMFFLIIKGKDCINNPNDEYDKLMMTIEQMEEKTYIPGKVISSHKRNAGNAKYHSDTYVNGNLTNTYESDWRGEPFPRKESTYRSGNDTYKTVTYYTPPTYIVDEEREPGTYDITPGIDVFIRNTYVQM